MPFRCGAGSTAEGTAKQRVVLEISCLYRDGIRSLGFFRTSLAEKYRAFDFFRRLWSANAPPSPQYIRDMVV
ncbi:uncharacterized protein N7469_008782 [Penicillium citrinum]|uniref:Uncharacterized protein n=2 Tax=Penicillium TaxID=5073 RepID=A0A9W9TH10_PENCI|nr:uncharacterized protein N7469_008782 [Penicillium citrinum]KAJ5222542.1 hypothetical protein N7469_008782 [Penicillium citrinum]KAJ5580698.1 hypothetical protein N7450_006999 [Penicillium hetheringtonii]